MFFYGKCAEKGFESDTAGLGRLSLPGDRLWDPAVSEGLWSLLFLFDGRFHLCRLLTVRGSRFSFTRDFLTECGMDIFLTECETSLLRPLLSIILMHALKKNTLLSILSGSLVYILLINYFF